MDAERLAPAIELARANPVRMPNESAEYRAARTALLAEEIELRRHIERVAAQRRALPPGGPVVGDYRFQGEDGPTDLAGLFGDKADAGRLQLHVRARSGRARARCAPTSSAPGKATRRTSASAFRSWSSPARRSGA